MAYQEVHFNYRKLWLFTGLCLIGIVVYETLTTSPVGIDVPFGDKYMHTVGYFILMGWFVQIYHEKIQRVFWGVFFIGMGIGLEFLQELGGVRYFEVNDMLANGLGVVIAWSIANTYFSKILQQVDKLIHQKLN